MTITLQRDAKKHATHNYFKEDWFHQVFNKYIAAETWYLQRMVELTPLTIQNHNKNSPPPQIIPRASDPISAPLEFIKLLTFLGNQREWKSYKELITALAVDDQAMPLIIKFRRLISSLSSDKFNTRH